jgi:hypothetical protein
MPDTDHAPKPTAADLLATAGCTTNVYLRNLLRAGADAMDDRDAARKRVAELEAGLEACDVSMETCSTLGYAQLMPDVYRDSWARAAIEARRLLAKPATGGAG